MFPFVFSALWIFLFVTAVFFIALLKKDNSIIDIFYGLVFVDVALMTYVFMSDHNSVATLVTLLVVLWGIRLSGRIFFKNYSKPEDKRYALWREEWLKHGTAYFVLRSYIQVFLLQGIVVWLVSLPIVLANTTSSLTWNVFVTAGLIVWLVGFVFETVADFQLDTFLRHPENRDKIMTTGLFRYSRRPNYFGESLQWWGVALIAFSSPLNWIGFISPAVITYIVVNVTGPITEKLWQGDSAYEAYKRTTSYFFPLPPKNIS